MFLDEVQKRAKRIDNLFLKKIQDTLIDNVLCENYDGVNLNLESENSGDIIRIRNLRMVSEEIIKGKDGKTIKKVSYLYSGYIYNTPDENDREITDLDKEAYPICFESSRKLEIMVKNNIKREIKNFLEFLSKQENFEREDTIKYIGHFYTKFKEDLDGIMVRCWYTQDKQSTSPTIQREIEKIQKDYLIKKGHSDNSDSTGNLSNSGTTANVTEYDDER